PLRRRLFYPAELWARMRIGEPVSHFAPGWRISQPRQPLCNARRRSHRVRRPARDTRTPARARTPWTPRPAGRIHQLPAGLLGRPPRPGATSGGVLASLRMRVLFAPIAAAVLGGSLGLTACGNSERAGAEEAQRQAEHDEKGRQAASPPAKR